MSKIKIGALIAAVAVALLCCIGGAVAVLSPSHAPSAGLAEPSETVTFTPSVTPGPKAKAKAVPTIAGDAIVRVGYDVPAGTYRASVPLTEGQWCYWVKSSDAEGDDVIAIDTPPGGRPQVTLKKEQWFRSVGCPIWRKQ